MLTNSLRGFNLIGVSMAFLIIIVWPMLLVYYYFRQLYLLAGVSWLLPLFLYGGLLSYALIFLAQTYIILKWVYNPRQKTGTFNINDSNPAIIYYSIASTLIGVNEKIFSVLLIPKVFYANLIFKLFAKHCGKKSLINPIPDPYLVSIGEESVIGRNVLIIGHEIAKNRIILKEVKIGNRVTIGANSIISPGAVIEDDAIVGANSYVKKDAVLNAGKFYAGCPAILKEKKKD